MDAASSLACPVEAADDLVALPQALRGIVDLQATHAVVDHRGHDGHMEGVVRLEGEVVEELLAPSVPRLAAAVSLVGTILRVLVLLVGDLVVGLESGLDV